MTEFIISTYLNAEGIRVWCGFQDWQPVTAAYPDEERVASAMRGLYRAHRGAAQLVSYDGDAGSRTIIESREK